MKLLDLLDNEIILDYKEYSAIIGESPSRGARSPVLWNKCFERLNIQNRMYPFDVKEENLDTLLNFLNADTNFKGGAIAVPYKELVANWLIAKGSAYISKEASSIGAVNSIFRSKKGHLVGTNTDGEAALKSLSALNTFNNPKILIVGIGGAGKAVTAFLTKLTLSKNLYLSSRSIEKERKFLERIDANIIDWPLSESEISGMNIVVNCTTLGSHLKTLEKGKSVSCVNKTIFGSSEKTFRALDAMRDDSIIFDIIYDPSPTKLLRIAQDIGLKTLDGSEMNLEQAVIAFSLANNKQENLEEIRSLMLDN